MKSSSIKILIGFKLLMKTQYNVNIKSSYILQNICALILNIALLRSLTSYKNSYNMKFLKKIDYPGRFFSLFFNNSLSKTKKEIFKQLLFIFMSFYLIN